MKIADLILDLLFPPKCAFCHRLSENRERVCDDCKRSISYTDSISVKQKFGNISCCVSPLYYEGHVRESLLRYKFGGVSSYADVYAEFMAKCIDENEISCDIITWVPLSARRLRRRGYDQARLIAEELSKKTGIGCVNLLRKDRDNPAQSGTGTAEKRRANVAGVYSAVDPAGTAGKKILIVDDIVTTGATLSECARMLKNNGAADVFAATAARGRG